jgi:glutamate synthase domain-containing protein 3
MTGGVAYVLDEGEELERRYNPQLVRIDPVEDPQEIAFLQAILERHVQFTGSPRAQRWLACWPEPMARFRRVQPRGLTRIRLPPLDALPAPELAVPMPLDLQGLLHPAPGAHGSLISLK